MILRRWAHYKTKGAFFFYICSAMVPSKQLIFHGCLPQFWLINAQIYPYSCRRYQHICCILFLFCFNVISIHYHTQKQNKINWATYTRLSSKVERPRFAQWKVISGFWNPGSFLLANSVIRNPRLWIPVFSLKYSC